ncbi:MAG: dihydroneopterin aldolase [Candidatus Thalassarchaeum sp.]
MTTSHSDAIETLLSSVGSASSLFLQGAIRKVEVGIHPHEHGSPQRIMFDIHVVVNESVQSSDSIDHVLDYEYLTSSLDRVIAMERPSLLETLITRILDEVMAPTEVIAASVSASKLDVTDDDSRLGCTMTRVR